MSNRERKELRDAGVSEGTEEELRRRIDEIEEILEGKLSREEVLGELEDSLQIDSGPEEALHLCVCAPKWSMSQAKWSVFAFPTHESFEKRKAHVETKCLALREAHAH